VTPAERALLEEHGFGSGKGAVTTIPGGGVFI
jgi:hypothetical protein